MARIAQGVLDGEAIVTSPHKVYGPEQNDLVLQLRKRGINKVILAGELAPIGTESFTIQGEPVRDRERLLWTLELAPA